MIDHSIDTARSLSVELVPPLLRDEGLTAALQWLGQQMQVRYKLQVKVAADHSIRLEEADSDVLYHSARELLLNVVKHAGTDRAVVRPSRDNGQVILEVSDQGAGFDTQRLSGSADTYGLFSIRERINAVGGAFEAESRAGAGTRITIRV